MLNSRFEPKLPDARQRTLSAILDVNDDLMIIQFRQCLMHASRIGSRRCAASPQTYCVIGLPLAHHDASDTPHARTDFLNKCNYMQEKVWHVYF